MKHVCVFLADGFEEIEALTVVDVLRRAKIRVETVSLNGDDTVQGAHWVDVKADSVFEEADFDKVDMLVLPGGMPGTSNLQKHKGFIRLLQKFDKEEKWIAAICAAPSILGALGMLKGRKACCYPSYEENLEGAEVKEDAVVQDGHFITGRGMGKAVPFALKLAEILAGKEKAEEIAKSIIYD